MARAPRISCGLGDRAIGADTSARYLPDGAANRYDQLRGSPQGSVLKRRPAARLRPHRSRKIAPMAEAGRDPAVRFSGRAEDYVKYRPHYSREVAQALQEACGLRPEHLIADVGCGTGLLAKIFLDNGNRVIGVEPNREMR